MLWDPFPDGGSTVSSGLVNSSSSIPPLLMSVQTILRLSTIVSIYLLAFRRAYHNDNRTIPSGESYCKDTCPRGNPAYLTSKSQLGMSPHVGCTTTHPCPDPFHCTDVASQSMCCPSRSSLCSYRIQKKSFQSHFVRMPEVV